MPLILAPVSDTFQSYRNTGHEFVRPRVELNGKSLADSQKNLEDYLYNCSSPARKGRIKRFLKVVFPKQVWDPGFQTPDSRLKTALQELISIRLRDRSVVPVVVLDTLLTGVFSKDPNRKIHLPKSIYALGNAWAWNCYSPSELKPRKARLSQITQLKATRQDEPKIREVKSLEKPILKSTVRLRKPLSEVLPTPGIVDSPASVAVNENETVSYPDPRVTGEPLVPAREELPPTGLELPSYLTPGEVFTFLGKDYRWEHDPYQGSYYISTIDEGIRVLLIGNPRGYKTQLNALVHALGMDRPTAKAMLG